MTTRRSRTLAWLGTIPHWFYFAALRNNQPLWYQIVVWTSGLGCRAGAARADPRRHAVQVVAAARIAARATGIPYSGWMRWHYITGVIFGVFTLTWVFSGLLSMEPFGWATQPGLQIPRDAFTGGAVELCAFPADGSGQVGTADGRRGQSRKWSSSESRTIRIIVVRTARESDRSRRRSSGCISRTT